MSKMGRQESDGDFNTVTILRKHAPPVKKLNSQSALNAAQRRGDQIETTKKYFAGQNRQHKTDKNTAQLDEETEELHHDRVNHSVSQAIAQARLAKEMSQKDLSLKISEKVEVVREYEAGKAIPNQQVLTKMERVLGVKLRGKDIGQPFVPPAPKKK